MNSEVYLLVERIGKKIGVNDLGHGKALGIYDDSGVLRVTKLINFGVTSDKVLERLPRVYDQDDELLDGVEAQSFVISRIVHCEDEQEGNEGDLLVSDYYCFTIKDTRMIN